MRVVRSGKKVSFPMPRHSAILNLGGPLADRDHIEDMPLSTLRVVALGVTHPPRSTQLRRQLLFQHAAGLDEEAAIISLLLTRISSHHPHCMMRAMPTASLRSLLLICIFRAAFACLASMQMR